MALVALSAVIGVASVIHRDPVVPERKITDRPIQVAEDGYASSQTCKACHPSEYETWHGSYHRTMTQLATPETVIADFDGVHVNEGYGRSMRLERRGSQFWAEFDDPDDPDWEGTRAAPRRITRQVVMITGSHNQQIYWYPTGHSRVLGELPAIYVTGERRWIPRLAALMHPPERLVQVMRAGRSIMALSDALDDTDEARAGHRVTLFSETGRWNEACILCHTTHGKPAFAARLPFESIEMQVADTRATEFGISCEACHGPSEQHARLHRNPLRRYSLHLTGRLDPTTVRQAHLGPRRASQVCGQCHAVWDVYDRRGERQMNSGRLPYRPGDDLLKARFVAQPTRNLDAPRMKAILARDPNFLRDSFWSDGMIRVAGREYNGLIDSPCFENATQDRRTLSCLSCHTLHKTADDPRPIKKWADDSQLGSGMDGNEACLQCHTSFRTNLAAHTKHAAGSSGSSCYNCHMPYTTYGLLKTTRSHQISNPSVTASLETGRPNACNLCHLDRTLRWTSDQLEKWYGTPKATLAEDEESIAASLLWLLRGDAGQRAVVAQSIGWQPAQQASGAGWIAPYLAQLLGDPYDAVRFIAHRSMRSLPGFSAFEADFLESPSQRVETERRALGTWRLARRLTGRRNDAQLLFDPDGTVKMDVLTRLVRERDNRRVYIRE